MSGYVPGAVAGLFTSEAKEDKGEKKNLKLLRLFSVEKQKKTPTKEKAETPKTKKGKRKSIDTSEKSPSAKKRKGNEEKENKNDKKLKGKDGDSKNLQDRTEQRENRKKKKKDPEKDKRTIFVGNLPNKATKKHLSTFFKKYGTVESVRFRSAAPSDLKLPKKAIMNTKSFHPDLQSMIGYVVFEEAESAKKALESNGEQLEGRFIRVDLVKSANKHDSERSVFVGNVPFDAQEDDLREHFEDCGTVKNIRIIRDSRTGLGKGFCYILFEDTDGVSFALKLNGMMFNKRPLRVQRAEDVTAKGKKGKKEKKNVKEKVVSKSTSDKADEKKKKTFSRNIPSNVQNKDYHGVKAKRIEKIKKRRKHKKSIKKLKGVAKEGDKKKKVVDKSKKGPAPKGAAARRRIEKKIRKPKFIVKKY